MAKAIRLHRLGFMLGEAGGEVVDLAYGEFLKAQVDELTSTVDKTLEVVNQVTSDRGLNKKGIVERLQEIGNTARDQVRKISARRKASLEADLAIAQEGVPTELPMPVSAAAGVIPSLDTGGTAPLRKDIFALQLQQRLAEIRTTLMAYTEKGLRQAEVTTAAESGDLEPLLAIQTAPRIVREAIVHLDVFEKARTRWLELNLPDQFKQLSTVKSAIGLFNHNAQQADKLIAQATLQPLRNDVPSQLELERSLAATG